MKVNVHDPRGEELAQVLVRATAALAQVPSPRVDAELLAAHLLYGGSRSRLQHAALMGERLTPAQVAEYEALVARRAAREPLQHITGSAPFYRLELAVGPGVFVPRPETELLVEEALKVLAARTESATGQLRIVDLCTGSGAIAAAVKSELPNAQVFAVELSEEAIPYTRKNLEPLGVHLVQGDALTALPELAGTFDAVLRTLRTFRRRTYPPTRKPPCTTRTWHCTAGERTACRCPPRLPPAPSSFLPPAACSSWSTTTPRKKPSLSSWRALASSGATRYGT